MKPAHICSVLLLTVLGCSQSPSGPPDGPVGSFKVTATTTGAGAKPTLLQLLVDDDDAVIIDANGSHVFDNVSVGELVARVVVPGHCIADHYAPRTVEVEEGEVAELSWAIRCPLPTKSGISSVKWSTNAGAYVPWISNADGSGGAPIGGAPGLLLNNEVAALNRARTRLAHANPQSLALTDIDRGVTVTTGLGRVIALDWSPNGDQLLIVLVSGSPNDGGALMLVWADGVVERTIRTTGVKNVRWAPDGRRIAYREGSYIFIEDLRTGARLNTQHIHVNLSGGEPAWSPDGTQLAFVDTYLESMHAMDADGSGARVVATYSGFDGEVFQGSIDWGANDLLLLLKQGQPGHWGTPHVVPGSGGDVASLFDDGGSHYAARWAP